MTDLAGAAIFDLDGTLTDPFVGITESLRHAIARINADHGAGLPIPSRRELAWAIGPPLPDNIEKVVGVAHAAEGLAHYRERYGRVGLFENEVYPGIPEALAAVRASGARLYVATSKARIFAERIVEKFGLARYFTRVYGSEFDGTNIHKTDLLACLLRMEGLDPARCVMFGDRKHDAIGASANAIVCVGVAWGYGPPGELEGAGVAEILTSQAEIPAAAARRLAMA